MIKIALCILGALLIFLAGIMAFYSYTKLNIFQNSRRTVKLFLWNVHMDTAREKFIVFL